MQTSSADWLARAASPSFVLMACITASDASPTAPPAGLCASGSSTLPLDGMTAMYLLMSLFHMSPWLKLASRRPWARP